MRLTKVQKKLKELDIDYTYKEQHGTGELYYYDKDKNRYAVLEFTSNTGNTVIGILTTGKDFNYDTYNQTRIVNWLEEHKERFV